MPALYQLPVIYAEIRSAIDAADGEMPPMVEALLDTFTEDLERKTDSLCALIREQEGEAEVARNESRRLAAIAQSREKNAERMKRYLLENLQKMHIDRVKTPFFSVTVVNNSSAKIDFTGDLLDLPTELLHFDPELNKDAVKKWIETGKALPEGLTVERGTHLRIR